MVFVRHGVLRVEVAGRDEVDGGLVVERGEVLATIIIVLLNNLLASFNHMFHSCCFLLLATVLLSFLGIGRKSAVCCCGNSALISLLRGCLVLN